MDKKSPEDLEAALNLEEFVSIREVGTCPSV